MPASKVCYIWNTHKEVVCKTFNTFLTKQYELLGVIDKKVENTIDIVHFETGIEESDAYEQKIVLARARTEYKVTDVLKTRQDACFRGDKTVD